MNNSYRGWPDTRVYKKNLKKEVTTFFNSRYSFDFSNQKYSSPHHRRIYTPVTVTRHP